MAALGPAPDELLGLAGGPPPGAPPEIQIGPEGGGGPAPGGMAAPGGAPGGGMPPELAALLGGGGGPEGGPPGGGEGEARSETEVLGEIRDLCMEYMQIASDDIEKDKIAQALKIVQSLFASNQQQTEAASGTTPAMKGMARAITG
jgi:hypothetical protein